MSFSSTPRKIHMCMVSRCLGYIMCIKQEENPYIHGVKWYASQERRSVHGKSIYVWCYALHPKRHLLYVGKSIYIWYYGFISKSILEDLWTIHICMVLRLPFSYTDAVYEDNPYMYGVKYSILISAGALAEKSIYMYGVKSINFLILSCSSEKSIYVWC